MKYIISTLGCKVNQFETETMEGLFKQKGYEIVPFEETADFYVINTCSVTSLGDRKSRQIIRRAQRQNEQKKRAFQYRVPRFNRNVRLSVTKKRRGAPDPALPGFVGY